MVGGEDVVLTYPSEDNGSLEGKARYIIIKHSKDPEETAIL